MESILVISRILSEYKSIFKEEDIDVTLNEALVLKAVKSTHGTKANISKTLLKDRAYIYRLIDTLIKKGLLERKEKPYRLTQEGSRVYEQSSEICKVVMSSEGLMEIETENYPQSLVRKTRETLSSIAV